MRFARLPPLPLLVPVAAAAAALAAGCGSSPEGTSSSNPPPGERSQEGTAPPGASAQGCGNTVVAGVGELRVTGVGCAVGRGVVASWVNVRRCSTPAGASRYSCTVAGYRCLGAATDRGIAVSCALPGRSISFVARRQ